MKAKRFFYLIRTYVFNPVKGFKVTKQKLKFYHYRRTVLSKRQAEYSEEAREIFLELSGDYEYWIKGVEAGYDLSKGFSYNPLISVIVPVYNVSTELLSACVDSVREQVYGNWELILMDDCSPMEGVWEDCLRLSETDSRIKAYHQEKNGGISSASNAALSHAKGEFVALLDCDDIFSPNALYENVKLLNEKSNLDFIYSDEDKINEEGTSRFDPFFKPDFSPDTLLSYMYICHLSVYRRSILERVGGFRSEFDGSQDYDLALRVSEETKSIGHIPKVLYHWRTRKGSTADDISAKSYTIERSARVKEDALRRRGITGHAQPVPGCEHTRVVYKPAGEPLVSIIIPSKDHPKVLRTCISSLRQITTYKNYEIVVVDNGSSAENKAAYEAICDQFGASYNYHPMEFNFSKMCNMGAALSKGDYFLFLNDDTQIINKSPHWLSSMLGCAMQRHVGAVGAKLYYSDGKSIQHVGVVNSRSGPGHFFSTYEDNMPLYFNKNMLDYDVIAVTAACLLIDKRKFEEIEGFDEGFAVAYNDVDFCFKLYEKGYYNVVRNDAVLIHHESLSRGYDLMDRAKAIRLRTERERLYAKHPDLDGRDPFYNENLNSFAPDHEFNFDRDYDFYVKEDTSDYPEGPVVKGDVRGKEGVAFDITAVVVDWAIQIMGWALFLPDNKYEPFEILLTSRTDPKVSYRLATRRKYMWEVCAVYFMVQNSEFSGFRTMSARELVSEGEYEVYFLKDGVKYPTGEKVIV